MGLKPPVCLVDAHHEFAGDRQRAQLHVKALAILVLEGDADANPVGLLLTAFGVILDDVDIEAADGWGGVLSFFMM